MTERLLIVVNNSNPHNPCEIVEPIYNATVAAAMDYHVELIFSGSSGEILVKGVAESILTLKEDKTVYQLIQEAHETGVQIKATKHLTLRWGEELIPEVDDIVGAGYVISEVMGNSTETLCY
ncbi:peroxiredoxin [Ostreibacterium oceani]|uniref:Peroxiredoxin n=1 Tax=Ostreibacterium oceani TaxID=2654998 RepID=A0A6N7ES01_9GAMM|nr:peroxiredoxin [Ostreibacterium oceani]MPV85272.1 peroxiredoxin [Ostreibacterium oceani]